MIFDIQTFLGGYPAGRYVSQLANHSAPETWVCQLRAATISHR